jgi:phosphoribosyl 1,2-cyclic phosphodiesterase
MFPSNSSHPADGSNADAVSVQSLGSGSSGNAFLIQTADTSLLLDCGVGIRTMARALKERGQRLDDLDAVLVTHEHSDHIRTLSCVIGKDVPIISTAGTRRRANIPPPQWEQIGYDMPVSIRSTNVWAIMVKHDAAEPCGYLVETPTTRISVFTDLGSWHDRLVEPVLASDLVVLESNHDQDMLLRGPYPAYLKRRVASPVGHLSNADCAASLASTLGQESHQPDIWLAHLSETNNEPEIARDETHRALNDVGLFLNVTPLPRKTPGPVWTSTGTRDDQPWKPVPKVPASLQLSLDAF